MAAELILLLPYPPAGTTGNHAVKHSGGRHYLTEKAKRFLAHVNQAVACQNGKRGFTGPIEVYWAVCPPDRRSRDADNCRKTLADALTKAGVWVDDSNKVIRREVFAWGEPVEGGRVTLEIHGYNDEK